MTAGRPATPAMTPVAATVKALLDAALTKDRASRAGVNRSQLEGEAIGLDAAAALVRERLAPAWDRLAAENASLREQLKRVDEEADAQASDAKAVRAHLKVVTAERDRLADERDRARGTLAEISGQCGCADEQCPASIARQRLEG